MKLMGLDFGTRRIGVAVSDGPGWAAQGVATIERRGGEWDFAAIERLAGEHQVEALVVGLPLNMDGSQGRMAELARRFAAGLADRLGFPVHLWDERLTSFEADQQLDQAQVPARRRKAKQDQVAAALILQGFLEARSGSEAGKENPR